MKGPDTLVAVLERLREEIPELFVARSAGPARGYVRRELESRGIPHRHVLSARAMSSRRPTTRSTCTLVTSRQEGGPKAALESMAAGVPLVTTRVGQAQELVVDGENGLLADVDDVEALGCRGLRVIHDDPALG